MSNDNKKRSSFSGTFGFVMAAAGSAVGLGNIWRFPYLAAKNGGGVFLLIYLILVLTFGFTLLTTEVAIGRKTKQGPLTAYTKIHRKFAFNGILAWLVPVIILPYYCTIGGWVLKYLVSFVVEGSKNAATENYFTSYITSQWTPLIGALVFFGATAFIVFSGVEKGIEKYSKILMPILIVLIIVISIFSLTLKYTDSDGVTRTGLQGLAVYIIPDFSGITIKGFFQILMDAVGQLFYSISVAMGIMITYGSYVPDDANLMKSINQIEFFDTLIAVLAGLMIIPAVFVFMGVDGMSKGPGLMFVSLPMVFDAMGKMGRIIGIMFFLMVSFAAITSSVSVMEAIVAGLMDKWNLTRKKSAIIVSIYTAIMSIIVCLGYNVFYFELKLPNGSVGQILDLMDYISNNVFMALVAISTCILVGWIVMPKTVIDEIEKTGVKFGRKHLYIAMIKFIVPALLFILLLQSFLEF